MPDKTYKIGKDIYDIPNDKVSDFLKDNPKAVEVETYISGKDTYDIPLPEVASFIQSMPDAKPLKKKEDTNLSGKTVTGGEPIVFGKQEESAGDLQSTLSGETAIKEAVKEGIPVPPLAPPTVPPKNKIKSQKITPITTFGEDYKKFKQGILEVPPEARPVTEKTEDDYITIPEVQDELVRDAQKSYNIGDLPTAKALTHEVLNVNPLNTKANELAASVAGDEGDYGSQATFLKLLLQEDTSRTDLLPQLAYAEKQVGNGDAANEAISQFISIYEPATQRRFDPKTNYMSNLERANNMVWAYDFKAGIVEDAWTNMDKRDYWQNTHNDLQADINKYEYIKSLQTLPDYLYDYIPFTQMSKGMVEGVEQIIKGTAQMGVKGAKQFMSPKQLQELNKYPDNKWHGVVNILGGAIRTGMAAGWLFPAGEAPIDIMLSGAGKFGKVLNVPLGFFNPGLQGFNATISIANMTPAAKYTEYLLAPVSKALEAGGVDLTTLTDPQREGLMLWDMVTFMTILHGARIGGDAIIDQTRTIVNKMSSREPLTNGELDFVRAAISEGTVADALSGAKLIGEFDPIAFAEKKITEFRKEIETTRPEDITEYDADPVAYVEKAIKETEKAMESPELKPEDKQSFQNGLNRLTETLNYIKEQESIKENNVEVDKKAETAQKELGLPTEPYISLKQSSIETLDKLEKDEPVINKRLGNLADDLHDQYWKLENLKKSNNRKYTIKQIESKQEKIGEYITQLEEIINGQLEAGKFVTDKKFNENIKEQDNAVQKQETGQVDVPKTPPDGEKMGERNAESEIIAGKGEGEKGGEEEINVEREKPEGENKGADVVEGEVGERAGGSEKEVEGAVEEVIKGTIEGAKEEPIVTPEQEKANQRKKHNDLVDLYKQYEKMDGRERKSSKAASLKNKIINITNELGYKYELGTKGFITVKTKDGKKLKSIGERPTTESIQQAPAFKDYEPEFQDFVKTISSDLEQLGGYMPRNNLSRSQIKQALRDIKAGKKSKAANDLLESLKKDFDEGEVEFNETGATGMMAVKVKYGIPEIIDRIKKVEKYAEETQNNVPDALSRWMDETDEPPYNGIDQIIKNLEKDETKFFDGVLFTKKDKVEALNYLKNEKEKHEKGRSEENLPGDVDAGKAEQIREGEVKSAEAEPVKPKPVKKTKEEKLKVADDKISGGFDDLAKAFGAKMDIEGGIKPDVIKAIKQIAEGMAEKFGIKGEELFDRVKEEIIKQLKISAEKAQELVESALGKVRKKRDEEPSTPGTRKYSVIKNMTEILSEKNPELAEHLKESGDEYLQRQKPFVTKEAKALIEAAREADGGIEMLDSQVKNTKNEIPPDTRNVVAGMLLSEYSNRINEAVKSGNKTEQLRNEKKYISLVSMLKEWNKESGQQIQANKWVYEQIRNQPQTIIGEVRGKMEKNNHEKIESQYTNEYIDELKSELTKLKDAIKGKEITIEELKRQLDELKVLPPRQRPPKPHIEFKKKEARKLAGEAMDDLATIFGARKTLMPEEEVTLVNALKKLGKAIYLETEALGEELIDLIKEKIAYKFGSGHDDFINTHKGEILSHIEELRTDKLKNLITKLDEKMSEMRPDKKAKFILDSINDWIEKDTFTDTEFKNKIAEALGYKSMTPEMEAKIRKLVDVINEGADAMDVLSKDPSNRKLLREFDNKIYKARKANEELSEFYKKDGKFGDWFVSMMQLKALTPVSLIQNPLANALDRFVFRTPIEALNAGSEFAIAGMGKLLGIKSWQKVVNDFPTAQKAYLKELSRQVDILWRQKFDMPLQQDFAARELTQKIHPLKSFYESFEKLPDGEKRSVLKRTRKFMEGLFGVDAAIVAKMLELGDLPFRNAAEASKAAGMGGAKGLKGESLDRFTLIDELKPLEEKELVDAGYFKEEDGKYYYKDHDGLWVPEKYEKALVKANESYGVRSKVESEEIKMYGKNEVYQEKMGLPGAIEKSVVNIVNYLGDKPVIGAALKVLARSQFLFMRTPLNVFKRFVMIGIPELNMLTFLYHASRGEKYKAINSLNTYLVGMTLQYVIGQLVQNDIVSGSIKEEDEAVKEMRYKFDRPYELNTSLLMRWIMGNSKGGAKDGDRRIAYNKTGIVGMVVGLNASKYKGMSAKEIKDMNELKFSVTEVFNKISSLASISLEQPFVQGTSNTLNALQDGDRYGTEWLNAMINTTTLPLVPNWLSTISRSKLEVLKETKDEDMWQTILNRQKIRLFSGKELAPKIDISGEQIPIAPEGRNDVLFNLFSIFKGRKVDTKHPYYRLYSLYKTTGDSELLPTSPSHTLVISGEKIKLSSKLYSEYSRMSNQAKLRLAAVDLNNIDDEEITHDELKEKLRDDYEQGQKWARMYFILKYATELKKINPNIKIDEETDFDKLEKQERKLEKEKETEMPQL